MTGVASAQPKPPQPPKTAPKPDDKKPEGPKPAPEIAEMARSLGGNWKCEGTAAGMDGKDQKFKAALKSKVELDGWWLHETMEGAHGDAKDATKVKMESFTTFDAATKKYRRVSVFSSGLQMVGTSDGMRDFKMDFQLDTASGMGAGQFRDHVDASDMKKGVRNWGEMSMDKGKTWMKIYDIICKKS